MRISYKIVAAAAALLLTASYGCSEWTEPESVNIKVETLKDSNPELYADYLQSLRDYRSSDHKLMIAKFDNQPTAPAGRSEHINCLPDSVDYVILNNPAVLSDATKAEMKEIRDDKGIRTLYTVSYDGIEDEYQAYVEELAAAAPEEGDEEAAPAQEPMSFEDFLTEKTAEYLSLCDKYSYDGIVVSYSGVYQGSLPQESYATLLSRQTIFFGAVADWISTHSQAVLFFEGIPYNVIYEDFDFAEADCVIIPALSASGAEALSYTVQMALSDRCPADRVVIGVTMPSLVDDGSKNGLFTATDADGNNVYAVNGAAQWVNTPASTFTKAGVCVDHAQYDYFNIEKTYSHIREAISEMNPSPLI